MTPLLFVVTENETNRVPRDESKDNNVNERTGTDFPQISCLTVTDPCYPPFLHIFHHSESQLFANGRKSSILT